MIGIVRQKYFCLYSNVHVSHWLFIMQLGAYNHQSRPPCNLGANDGALVAIGRLRKVDCTAMVLDPFSATGLAGNTVQFVDFKSKLFSKAYEIYRYDSCMEEHRGLNTLCKIWNASVHSLGGYYLELSTNLVFLSWLRRAPNCRPAAPTRNVNPILKLLVKA
ncbi:hypothetical protein SLS56_006923 [Neofusicoccum ribis]|uniref:Uncharacterized protein n=1 Tax=Neofusicoccum ribis TaxID=45134 RepID=A0ABR3SPF4_9PEZI